MKGMDVGQSKIKEKVGAVWMVTGMRSCSEPPVPRIKPMIYVQNQVRVLLYGANQLNTTKVKQSLMPSLMSQIDRRKKSLLKIIVENLVNLLKFTLKLSFCYNKMKSHQCRRHGPSMVPLT
jgi:hypothetical protein